MVAKTKNPNSYAIVIEPLSPSDGGGWLATVPALPGCMGDGETPEEALADAEAAVSEWIDAARRTGRAAPASAALGQWRQRVPRSLHEKLKIVAAREGVSLNAYVANVLAEAIGRAR
jgi:antitoxin HicB